MLVRSCRAGGDRRFATGRSPCVESGVLRRKGTWTARDDASFCPCDRAQTRPTKPERAIPAGDHPSEGVLRARDRPSEGLFPAQVPPSKGPSRAGKDSIDFRLPRGGTPHRGGPCAGIPLERALPRGDGPYRLSTRARWGPRQGRSRLRTGPAAIAACSEDDCGLTARGTLDAGRPRWERRCRGRRRRRRRASSYVAEDDDRHSAGPACGGTAPTTWLADDPAGRVAMAWNGRSIGAARDEARRGRASWSCGARLRSPVAAVHSRGGAAGGIVSAREDSYSTRGTEAVVRLMVVIEQGDGRHRTVDGVIAQVDGRHRGGRWSSSSGSMAGIERCARGPLRFGSMNGQSTERITGPASNQRARGIPATRPTAGCNGAARDCIWHIAAPPRRASNPAPPAEPGVGRPIGAQASFRAVASAPPPPGWHSPSDDVCRRCAWPNARRRNVASSQVRSRVFRA